MVLDCIFLFLEFEHSMLQCAFWIFLDVFYFGVLLLNPLPLNNVNNNVL